MLRENARDIIGGLALLGIGLFFSVNAVLLGTGTGRLMGPGYFPLLAGAFTSVVSLFIIIPALLRLRQVDQPEMVSAGWRAFSAIMASIVAFIVTMPSFGLMPAIVATTLVSAMANEQARPVPTLVLAVVLSIGAWLVFLVGLGLPIRPYRWPF